MSPTNSRLSAEGFEERCAFRRRRPRPQFHSLIRAGYRRNRCARAWIFPERVAAAVVSKQNLEQSIHAFFQHQHQPRFQLLQSFGFVVNRKDDGDCRSHKQKYDQSKSDARKIGTLAGAEAYHTQTSCPWRDRLTKNPLHPTT